MHEQNLNQIKLSIIIPCYNCSKTLEEAVDSVYLQKLKTPFEIVMVDDKSTDGTAEIMHKLSLKHKEIQLHFHEKNKGGGAARNTGIKNSVGNLIYCLDSDNLLYPDSLQKMIDYLLEKKADGVVIQERRYFQEKNQEVFSSHINKLTNKPITLQNLLDESEIILDNFLFTRIAFNKTTGYPEKHGFDTQCFEFRFLAAGNTALVCPGSIFLHRQAIDSKGYFHRVYEAGHFSVNFYLIFEEILYLFSNNTISKIINYDIFKKNKLGKNNIKAYISGLYKQHGDLLFRENYKDFLTNQGENKFDVYLENPSTPEEKFVKAILLFRKKNFKESLVLYKDIETVYPRSKIVKFNIARCQLVIEGVLAENFVEAEALIKTGYHLKKRKMVLNAGPIQSILVKLKSLIIN